MKNNKVNQKAASSSNFSSTQEANQNAFKTEFAQETTTKSKKQSVQAPSENMTK
ncbi:hypothetical protein [Paenibacillus swuensis]|uniref:hypothetical protein n=1 Tax=Paenibacillus swuensis TaxID=1178515 RepID=UPI000ABF0A52|nr:hypothetical protein [Paenibacillus swuensis]